MKVEDANKVIESFRKQGYTDEQIQYAFAMMYFNNQIDLDGFNGLINLLGYHLDDEFLKLSKAEQLKWFKGER